MISVGTSRTRSLETVRCQQDEFVGGSGWRDIFIYGGYEFKGIDGVIRNLDLAKWSLVMLVSA
ncbi:S-adenosylmethionine:tRNA ribosyltransferase-isomerase, partial [Staphylococcus pettenkoferi]|uniref:S-adenosylmethionine:tRNA ribosyltransferase-isomerase n=1 Tax=Staphylococcus pettenkoferi TaxID=170573 RepID=UPI0021B6C966